MFYMSGTLAKQFSTFRELYMFPCDKEKDFHCFGIENDMVRDLTTIPESIQIHFRKLSVIEEMLLSPVISIMSVFCLSTGGNVARGFVANFKQSRRCQVHARNPFICRSTSVYGGQKAWSR